MYSIKGMEHAKGGYKYISIKLKSDSGVKGIGLSLDNENRIQ